MSLRRERLASNEILDALMTWMWRVFGLFVLRAAWDFSCFYRRVDSRNNHLLISRWHHWRVYLLLYLSSLTLYPGVGDFAYQVLDYMESRDIISLIFKCPSIHYPTRQQSDAIRRLITQISTNNTCVRMYDLSYMDAFVNVACAIESGS